MLPSRAQCLPKRAKVKSNNSNSFSYPPFVDHVALFIGSTSLSHIQIANVLFNNANSLVEPGQIAAQPFNFHCRKPLSAVLCRFAERLQMPLAHKDRQEIRWPSQDF